jgi:putative phosphoserine phosphatase/1-acylglycerol-3-phosphate O-acyltransferase
MLAAARRWPTIDLSTTERRPPRIPIVNLEIQRLAMAFTNPMFIPFARFDIDGVDNIPRSGPAILAGNHRSYFDTVAMAVTIARSNRTVRFLGKKEVFDAPVIGQLAAAFGGIRVDRGTGSDEPLRAAADALERGEMVALMPQGTIPRGKAFFDPQLRGRWGAARLAAMTRAPVIPIGLWGTEKVWPRSARLPNLLNVTNPPLITVRVGHAVELKYRSPDADTRRIMQALMDLLPPESRVARQPTDEEIALATPANARRGATEESMRRPGSD